MTPLLRVSYGVLALLVTATAHADVTRNGTTLVAEELQLAPLSGAPSVDVGASIRNASGAEQATLEMTDAEGVCGATARACADVWTLPGLLVRQCARDVSCPAGSGTANLETVSWVVVARGYAAVSTELAWTRAGGPPLTLPEIVHAKIAALPASASARDYSSGMAAPPSVSIAGWPTATCAPTTVLDLDTTNGRLLATAIGSGATAPQCRSAGTSALDLWAETPVDGSRTSVTVAVRPTAQSGDAEALVWRDRWTSSPTASVIAGERWLLSATDLIPQLGVHGLAFASAPDRLWFTMQGTSARPLRDPTWLARGHLPSERQMAVYHDDGPAPVLTRVPFASLRIQSPAGAWQEFTSGSPMCARSGDRGCLELGSPVPFSGADLAFLQVPTTMAVSWRYWDGAMWRLLDVRSTDPASSFLASGSVRWTVPADWQRRPALVDSSTSLPLYVVRAEADPSYVGSEPVAQSMDSDLLLIERRGEVTGSETLLFTYNERPLARLVASAVDAQVGVPATLDASASVDPDGDTLTFAWSLSSGPRSATVVPQDSAKPAVTLQEPGVYVFALRVSDGELESEPTFVTVRAGTRVEFENSENCASTPATPWALLALAGLMAAASFARRRGSR